MNRDGIVKRKDPVLTVIDSICAVLLALCPLLQHYISPLFNAGILVMVVIAAYLVFRMLMNITSIKWSYLGFVAVMVVYQVFRIVNHGTSVTEFGQSGVFIVFVLALALGVINTEMVMKACRVVCVLASCYLVMQYFTYYLFKIHLQLVPTELLIPSADQWVLVAQSGLAGVTGRVGSLYRPSAFFLEPAHVYLYMFPHLALMLFNEKITKKSLAIAAFISLGMVLTTSGMGIAAVVGIWGLFLIFRDERDGTFSFKNILRKRNLIALGLLVVAFAGAMVCVPFVRQAVMRIFVPGTTGKTAIDGRVDKALELVLGMQSWQWVFGVADNTHGMSVHMPGLLDVLYRHGVIGCLLSYELYVKCICKLPVAYKLIGGVVLVTSLFSAHTHSTVGMLYFLLILMNGFHYVSEDKQSVRPYSAPNNDHFLYRIYGKLFARKEQNSPTV